MHDNEITEDAEIQGEAAQPVPDMRPGEGLYGKIRHLQDMFQAARSHGRDPRDQKVELVI